MLRSITYCTGIGACLCGFWLATSSAAAQTPSYDRAAPPGPASYPATTPPAPRYGPGGRPIQPTPSATGHSADHNTQQRSFQDPYARTFAEPSARQTLPGLPPQAGHLSQHPQPASAQPAGYAHPASHPQQQGDPQAAGRVHAASYAGAAPPIGHVPQHQPHSHALPAGYHPQQIAQAPSGHMPTAAIPQAGQTHAAGTAPHTMASAGTQSQMAYYAGQPVAAGPPPSSYGQVPAGHFQPSPAQTAHPQMVPAGHYPVVPAGYVSAPLPPGGEGGVAPAQYTVPGVAAVPGAVPAAAPTGIAGCFAGLCQVGTQLKSCWCKSAIGQMVGTIISPLSGLTGGIIPNCCATPTPGDLAKPGAEGAASAIQANAAAAKARRAAVKYLGTVDCHWFPEAEAGLIGALRADPIECVRWEAAHQLRNGCCCTKKVIEALRICVQGSCEDGNPSENSPRVRAEAFLALQECLSCGSDGSPSMRPEMPQRPESPDAVAAAASNPYFHAIGYYREGIELRTREQVVADAQALLARVHHVRRSNQPSRGNRSLMELWAYAGRPQPADPNEPIDPDQPLRPISQPGHQLPPTSQRDAQPRAIYTAAVPPAPGANSHSVQVQRLPSAAPSPPGPTAAPSPPIMSPPAVSPQAVSPPPIANHLPGESAFGPAPRRASADAGPGEVHRLPLMR